MSSEHAPAGAPPPPRNCAVSARALATLWRLEVLRLVRDWRVTAGLVPTLFLIPVLGIGNPSLDTGDPVSQVAEWSMMAVALGGAGFCAAFVDLASGQTDGSRGPDDVIEASPFPVAARSAVRMAAALAFSLPVLLILMVVGVSAALSGDGVGGMLAAVPAYLLVVVPGLVVAMSVAAALGAHLRPTVARVLGLALWAWAILLSPALVPLPSPSGTLLTPVGDYAAVGFFGAEPMFAGTAPWLSPEPSSTWAVVAVAALLALAAALLASNSLSTRRRSL